MQLDDTFYTKEYLENNVCSTTEIPDNSFEY